MKVEGSTFPNWSGTERKLRISTLTADELKITNPGASAGGQNEAVFSRIK
jgi:hypothetical protein